MELQRALNALSTEDLFPVWCWVDDLERAGRIDQLETRRWKHGIFGLIELWGVERVDLDSDGLL